MSRSVMVALLAGGCLTAAAGGSYLAVRQNAVQPLAAPVEAVQPPAAPGEPVHETEGVIEAPEPKPEAPPAADVEPEPRSAEPEPRIRTAPAPRRERPRPAIKASQERTVRPEPAAPAYPEPAPPTAPPIEPEPALERSAALPDRPIDPLPVEPVVDEIVIPASAVIGLEIETTVTSERAGIEDRVDARVTRDVFADGRLALPAGSRVTGAVTLVERGGKVKERARLGVRFHTLVLADGSELPLRSEPIFREGESPAGDSSRKIGGAAVGGAILGAIFGGGKGAVIGGATGAAGGTAAVMAGDRHPATLASGTILTVRLTSPVDIQVEKR